LRLRGALRADFEVAFRQFAVDFVEPAHGIDRQFLAGQMSRRSLICNL
jgi:hypothetical protein